MMTDRDQTIDSGRLRRTMGRFATGVAVVTTFADGNAEGMTVNSLTSVSLDPPLLLVSLTEDARTTGAIRSAGRFAVSVVSTRQEEIARRFARSGEDHFAGLPLEYGEHDVPVIPDALAHLECVTDREVPAADHVLFLGRIVMTCAREGEPLTFYAGSFGEFSEREHGRIDWFF